jgi:DNA modification methylase
MVWVKSAPCGFLNAKKMPMKKHEMLYVFYRKLPFYDLSSHKYKFLKEEKVLRDTSESMYGSETGKVFIYDEKGKLRNQEPRYEPSLPTSILRETDTKQCYDGNVSYNYEERDGAIYEPPLPNSILEIRSEKGKHATQKPTALIEWCLKYYSKEGDTVLDPTAGSGTTAVACKKMNRHYICIEKDPEIFKIMEDRILKE